LRHYIEIRAEPAGSSAARSLLRAIDKNRVDVKSWRQTDIGARGKMDIIP
jgi:hypothetical protein